MAPKAKAAAPVGILPAVEDEVLWPEGVEQVPDPAFRSALAHLVSHNFVYEGASEEPPAPLVSFDPCASLLARLREEAQEDPMAKPLVLVAREDLESLVSGGEVETLAQAFVLKAKTETLARHRRKINSARKRRIEETEAGEAAEPPICEGDEGAPDLVFAAIGYPNSAEELDDLQSAGGFEAASVWVSLYLGGMTVEELEAEEGEQPARVRKSCDVPEVINAIYDYIHSAPVGGAASHGTVRSVPDGHRMALQPDGGHDRVMESVMRAAREVCEQRLRFEKQLASELQAKLPRLDTSVCVDLELYDRLLDSVDPSQHDVPFMLFCMCEQVGHSLQGDVVDRKEDYPELASGDADEQALLGLLAEAHNRVGGDLVPASASDHDNPEHHHLAELEAFLGQVVEAFRQVEINTSQLRARRGEGIVEIIAKLQSLISSARGELDGVVAHIGDAGAQEVVADAVRKAAVAEAATLRASDANAALPLATVANAAQLREEAADSLGDLELAVEAVSAAVAGAKDYCIMRRVSAMREDEAARQASFAASAQASGRAALSAVELEMAVVLPTLDYAACRHYGHQLPGGVMMLDEIHRILGQLEGSGIRRAGFPPETAVQPKAVRTAICNRFYDFMPMTPIVEVERMLLLHEFEKMLSGAHPERKWNLQDRVYHERIPGPLFVQTLTQATLSGYFIETQYMKRHDCLLIAMHHRVPAGCLLWHSWEAPTHLRPTPTFNDWWQQASLQSGKPKTDPTTGLPFVETLLDIDGRDTGYCKVLEKIHLPADGSVIIRTSFKRGQKDMFPRPTPGKDLSEGESAGSDDQRPNEGSGKGADANAEPLSPAAKLLKDALAKPVVEPYYAPPMHELRSTRIVKDGLSFNIRTDEVWAKHAQHMQSARLEKERAEAEAAAALEAERAEAEAARIAQGLPADETETGGEDSGTGGEGGDHERRASVDPAIALGITMRRVEDLKCGTLCVSFEGGARCAVRMHHERRWYGEGDLTYDITAARPGVVLTYTPVSGVLVQCFSDGAVRVLWPRQLLGGRFGGVDTVADRGPTRSSYEAGSPDDMELARVVTPFGTLYRELLSGRKEFYHPSGLRAIRNPTPEEVQQQFERLKSDNYGDGPLVWLRQLHDALAAEQLSSPPSVEAKAKGLPGHWRIIRSDGHVFGRASVPKKPSGEVAPVSDPDEPDATEPPSEPAASPAALLRELFGGRLTDADATLEYEVDQAVVPSLLDPHTGQSIDMEFDGLLRWADGEGALVTSILPDGTRVFRRRRAEGYELVFEQERAPRMTCTINDRTQHHRCIFLDVECEDGTRLKVTPQCLNLVGDLAPADPNSGDSATFSTNAAVTVHRRDGSVVSSKGAGEVDIISSKALGGGNMGSTLDRGQVYTAMLDEDKISIRDRDGNQFDAHGDQTVYMKLAVSMGDEFQSPRCTEPGKAYKHPDAEFLPVPERAPDPRLFVVYGDGDAEELLLTRDAQEILRLAQADDETLVLEERMGPPMEVCRCHSLQRSASSDYASRRLEPLSLPPIVNGSSAASLASGRPSEHSFVQFRQLVQYPNIDEAKHKAFLAALQRLAVLEESHPSLSRKPGAAVADATLLKLKPDWAPGLSGGA